jgi:uncharacterized protein YggE
MQSRPERPNTITVTGSAQTVVSPDEATISIAVVRQAPSAGTALAATNEANKATRDRLRSLGVADTDVRAGTLGLQPTMAYDGPTPRTTGYEGRIGFTIIVRSVANLDDILTQLVGSGVSELHGVSFGSSHATEAEDDARRAAIADAHRKATVLAEAAGRRLGAAVSIREDMDNYGAVRNSSFAMKASAEAMPGGLDIGVTARVTYQLE